MPAAPDAGEISEIKAIQAAYLKQYAEFEKEMTGKLGSLAGKYAQALDYLQKELVKAGKLDEATAVQTERTKAQTATKDFAEQLTERNSSSGMSSAATLSDNGGAMIGDYQVVDLSGGPTAETYPVTYARSLADVPGGANSDVYKTTRLLLRRIPKGTFTMGSPKSELGRSGNETQHQVTLSQDFYIGVFEVTQRQWERVTGEWPSHFSNVSCRDMRPVEEVTYNDIRGSGEGADWPVSDRVDSTSFMGRLRARTGKTFDLPTESQWEYACRAGTDTPLNSGKSLTTADASCPNVAEVGRYRFNGGSACAPSVGVEGATAKVGSYLPNAWGLYDMHGNDWEWCLDWFGNYPGRAFDPKGAPSGKNRVLRGGSLDNVPSFCRSACRNQIYPNYRYITGGFRVVVLLDQQDHGLEGGGEAGVAKGAQKQNTAVSDANATKMKVKWTKALEEARRDFLASNDLDSAEFVSRMLAALEEPGGLSPSALAAQGDLLKKRTRELVRKGVLESAATMNMAQWYVLNSEYESNGGSDGPVRPNRQRSGGSPGPGGQVLYLPFDTPPVNGVVRDESGADNHGRVEGAQWISEGRIGGAFRFTISKVDDRIVVPDSDSLSVQYVTMTAWIKASDKDGFWNRILDKDCRKGYNLCLGGDYKGKGTRGKLNFDANHTWVCADRPLDDGRWHHVSSTYDGKVGKLYVDGVEIKQAKAKNRGPIPRNHWDLCIGNSVVDYGTGEFLGFDGLIDEVRIYNRALSAEEIQTLASATKAGVNPPSSSQVQDGAAAKLPAAERIKQAKQLFDQGLMSKEDYDKKVKSIIESL